MFLVQLNLSTSILFKLIFEFNRAVNANEVDGPAGFGMGIFIYLDRIAQKRISTVFGMLLELSPLACETDV